MSLPRYNRAQVPDNAGGMGASHVTGESSRRGMFSAGEGTNLRQFGGNAAKKDRRFNGASAPQKENVRLDISFGTTGTTGRS